MQINMMDVSLEQREARQEDLARRLLGLMERVQALQELAGSDEEEAHSVDVPLLRQGLHELERLTSALLSEAQEVSGGLLLDELPGLPLGEALAQLVDATAESLGLSSRVAFNGWERPLSDYLARLLYRVAQEALARVATHAGARRLRFGLEYRRTEVVLMVEDDGMPGVEDASLDAQADENAGLPPYLREEQPEKRAVYQLANQTMRRLRTMVERLGGSLIITGGIEQGVQVQVRIPLHRPEHHGHTPDPASHAHEHHEHTEVRNGHTSDSASHAQAQTEARQLLPAVSEQRLRVLIVDHQNVARAGLRRLLESYTDLEVVGEASDGVQAVSETAELLPQIVLLGARLPEEQSLETLRQLRQLSSEVHILLLADDEDEALLYEALRAGASGYVLKDIASDELAAAVRGVARGDILVQPRLAARLLTRSNGQPAPESLTAREREVLHLLARGLRNKEIAARLYVSERTVTFHLANIYAKLHVNGRTEALSKALEQGLLKA